MYYKLHHQRRPRIPSLVAIMIVFLLIAALSTFFSRKSTKPSKVPQNSYANVERAEIANIRDNTITIFWRTTEPTEGYIIYGPSQLDIAKKIIDKRDTETLLTPRRNHIAVISNVTSNTEYFYNIVVNDKPIGQTQDIPFQFKTTRYLKNPLNLDPIVGKIVDKNGKISPETIVLLYIGSAYPLIAQTKADGSFIISPCCIFDSATYEPVFPQDGDKVVVEIIDEEGSEKKITSTLGDIDSIMSTIILDSHKESEAVPGVENDVLQMAEDVDNPEKIDIIFPRDHALIPGTRPLIKGVGIPGKQVKVSIQPGGRIFETSISSSNVWQFQPTFDLGGGEHVLEVTTEDENGKIITLERSFLIEKSGEAVLGDATPSARLTPEATPTLTATPTASLIPTDIPFTQTPTPPETGTNIIPFGFASLLLITVGVGMVFLF